MIRKIRNAARCRVSVLLAAGFLVIAGACSAQDAAPPPKPDGAANAQTPATDNASQQPVPISQTIKKESRLVLVDTVVTDKKGNYIHDLSQSDFKVYEDNKEQTITSFSSGANAAGPQSNQNRYLVSSFDNSSMALPDQISARAAAAKFIDANAAPDRLMAVVEFGGALRVMQNFTANAELLQAAAKGVKSAYVASNSDPGGPGAAAINLPGMAAFSAVETDYGARSMLLAVRTLAKNLRSVPGRKALVLFSSGFQLTPERQSELTATIDACNKSNVAVYALDVRGLQAPDFGGKSSSLRSPNPKRAEAVALPTDLQAKKPLKANLRSSASSIRRRLVLASCGEPQRPGGGGAGGGPAGGAGGGAGGGRGGGPGAGPGGAGGAGGTGAGGGRGPGGSGGTGATGGRGTSGGTTGGTRGGGTTGRGGGGGSTGNRGGFPTSYYNNPTNPLNQPRTVVPQFPSSTTTNQQVLAALAEGTGGFTIFNTNDLFGGLQRIASEQNEFYLLGYVPTESAEGSCHTLKVKMN